MSGWQIELAWGREDAVGILASSSLTGSLHGVSSRDHPEFQTHLIEFSLYGDDDCDYDDDGGDLPCLQDMSCLVSVEGIKLGGSERG